MKTVQVTICVSLVLLSGSVVLADWDIGQPYKWLQTPDLSTTGMDVRATVEPGAIMPMPVLADDFLCTETGPITDIHIWGSWLNDMLPSNANGIADAGAVTFTLSIHEDIPAGSSFSMPGPTLWHKTFTPGSFAAREWATNIKEGWYDPYTGQYIDASVPGDTIAYQYNFLIDPTDAFLQEGTAANPITYWLDVQATVPDAADPAMFGWKTSRDNWNDDAVYGTGIEPLVGGWKELIYPPGHPLVDESIDLAFVITPEPGTILLLIGGMVGLLRRRRS